ncbi:MAG: A24 family peptidase C-terminal domain-containing protein [Candidatus Altiarchaeota archaeon]
MVNFSFALFISLLLWFIGLWPAGDAKLFLLYSIFLSSPTFQLSGYTAMNLLINTFVPIFFFYIFFAFFKSDKKIIVDSFKHAFRLYNVFLIATIYLGLCWLITLPLNLIGIPTNLFLFILLLFFIVEILDKFSPFNLEFVYVITAVLRLIIDRSVYSTEFLTHLFFVVFIFLFFRFFILRLTFYLNTKKVKISDLKQGMRIAEGIIKVEKNGKKIYEKIPLIHYDIYTFLQHKKMKFIHNINEEGLTREDIEKLKNLREVGELSFGEILIHKQLPFAIFLFLGFLLTIYLKNDFVSALKFLIY